MATQVELNSLVVVTSDEVEIIGEIQSGAESDLEGLADDVTKELRLLLHCAEFQEDDIVADADPDSSSQVQTLKLLGAYIWLRMYYEKVGSEIDEQGFIAKARAAEKNILRQQRMALGLNKDCEPVAEPAVKTETGPSEEPAGDDFRLVGVG